jgi:hypothetical protein
MSNTDILRTATETLKVHHEDPAAPPPTPSSQAQHAVAEDSVTPPLPRIATQPACGDCSANLPRPAPICDECGERDYSECPDCGQGKEGFAKCHYNSRHTATETYYMCHGCATNCERCQVPVCLDCGRVCAQCEEFVCFGCSGLDEPSRLGDMCPPCSEKNAKRQKTEGAGGDEETAVPEASQMVE